MISKNNIISKIFEQPIKFDECYDYREDLIELIESLPDDPCERCKELEAKLTDYLHTSSHKVADKSISELEGLLRKSVDIIKMEKVCYGKGFCHECPDGCPVESFVNSKEIKAAVGVKDEE